jgi:hypothetical protein
VCRKNVITSETVGFYGLKKFPTYLEGTNNENFKRKMEMLERGPFFNNPQSRVVCKPEISISGQ